MMLTSGKQATYEYDLYDEKSVCLSARCKIDTHTEFNSCKRQAAAKTTKYSSTRITTLVFVHYYASIYSFSISTHTIFLHSSFTMQLYFTHFSVSSLSLSLSLLFSDRNHITKFTNITHTGRRMSPVIRAQLHIRDEKSSHRRVLLLNLQIEHHHHDTKCFFVLFLITSQEEKQKVNWKPRLQRFRHALFVCISILNIHKYFLLVTQHEVGQKNEEKEIILLNVYRNRSSFQLQRYDDNDTQE